jgi:hypothetical protein
MPVETCQVDGSPGYRWGDHGKCYRYEVNNEWSRKRARAKAERQGRAIKARQGMFGSWKGGTLAGLEVAVPESSVGDVKMRGGDVDVRQAVVGVFSRALHGALMIWNLGPARIAEFLEFAKAAMVERSAPVLAKYPTDAMVRTAIEASGSALATEIGGWTDDANTPKMPDGTLVIDSGAGTKVRLQQYILSWVDAAVTRVEEEAAARAAGPGFSLPVAPSLTSVQQAAKSAWNPETWADRWTWFEDGMNRARQELMETLPQRVRDIVDMDVVFSQVAAEIDMTTVHPATCNCELVNGAIVAIIKLYGQPGQKVLDPGDELDLWSQMLSCIVPEDFGKPWWEWGQG